MLSTKVAFGIFGAGALAYALTSNIARQPVGFAGLFRFRDLKLDSAVPVAANAKKYTFKFDNPEAVSGLEPGSFVVAKLKTAHGTIFRPYTPVSDLDAKGMVQFVVKSYPQGKMSSSFATLSPGDTVSFMGPIRAYPYKANEAKHVSMIAGGSGITPMFQLLQTISKNPADHTKVDLFYGSRSEDDILLRQEIEQIASGSNGRIKVHFFVSDASEHWSGNKGRVNREYLQQNMPAASENTKVFVCGPPDFYKDFCGAKPNPILQGSYSGILKDLGYSQKQVFKF